MISEVLPVVFLENIFFLYVTVELPVRYFRKIRIQLRPPSSEQEGNSQLKVEFYLIVEIKCQLDATYFFIADLIACSTCFRHHYAYHQELEIIIQFVGACVIWCFGFQVVGMVWS